MLLRPCQKRGARLHSARPVTRSTLPSWLGHLSPGGWLILLLALVSTGLVLSRDESEDRGMPFWIFSRHHHVTYKPIVERWNAQHPDRPVDMYLLQTLALERRMLSGFMSGTPVADLIEAERLMASRSFTGPVDKVGFFDVTDRLRDEGLLDIINEPSFAPWTTRGRIFGIPHDVHPVLLAYRADLVEAEGIDVSQIETWQDFFRVMRPLMRDANGDGRPDRYLLSGWSSTQHFVEMMILQADGLLFDEHDRPTLNHPRNAFVLATLATWFTGPNRMCTEVGELTAAGHSARLAGVVVATPIPDWMAGAWKQDVPGLAGKLKLMPLPAWERGGRRTSVWGGTMLGVAKTARDPEAAWAFAKELYLSPELADELFAGVSILTPVKKHWDRPIFHRPDPYFSGQPLGTLLIEQAPHVPRRSSSPFGAFAIERLTGVATSLHAYADRERKYTVDELLPEARRLLDLAQRDIEARVARNPFLAQ